MIDNMKKTKIVCTLGPASNTEEVLTALALNGMNVCRLNFSHGSHEEHKERMDLVKKVRKNTDIPLALMLDTKGPEIRTGNFEGDVLLETGDKFDIYMNDIMGNKEACSVSYKDLYKDVKAGDTILIDDGLVGLVVYDIVDVDGDKVIKTTVQNSGVVKSHKGVNVPGVKINLPAITNKDIEDIKFGIEQGIDFIAASFVRKASDVLAIREILEKHDAKQIQIISKIENQEGVENIDDILKVSDGVMVARGDLGVEIPTEEIPIVQKLLIKKCNDIGKPVITATQMLDSMIRNPRPTRAEVTDVANAIYDGTDAIMLSGETAAGKYPVNAVMTMNSIANRTEKTLDFERLMEERAHKNIDITDAISHATCSTAIDLGASAILTCTSSGLTTRMVSRFRPKAPIIAATASEHVMRRLQLVWGAYPVKTSFEGNTDDVIAKSVDAAKDKGYINPGEIAVITAGVPVGRSGKTNLIKVSTVTQVLAKGVGIGENSADGIARVFVDGKAPEVFNDGDIIVSSYTDKGMNEYIERASAIVTEFGGMTSHAAIVGINLSKPVVVSAEGALDRIKDGSEITVDTKTGAIYAGITQV